MSLCHHPRRLFSLPVFWIVASTSSFQCAQELDFVMLVDVSRSMSEDPATRQPGNDPQRLRWDAVKLVLDLLTEEDRALILPFNGDCPASAVVTITKQKVRIPGELPTNLDFVRGNNRTVLENRITDFIHDRNHDPTTGTGGTNVDWGGTAILKALGTVARKVQNVPHNKRRVIVVLLTDGKEFTTPDPNKPDSPDERLVETETWKTDPRITFFAENGIPIHTFGLGRDAAMEFLDDLATLTKGSSTYVESNVQLVERFRELIWSLRVCFKRKLDLGRDLTAAIPVEGITDLGVLCYELINDSYPDQRRTAFAPNPLPTLSWKGLRGQAAPVAQVRMGKKMALSETPGQPQISRNSGYSYHYFDGRAHPDDRRGGVFQRTPGIVLDMGFGSPISNRRVQAYLVKRIPIQFRLELGSGVFYRHQPIPLRVRIEPQANLTTEHFDVSATLHSPDAPEKLVRVKMVSATRYEFATGAGDFSAASLPPSKDLYDNYVLRVHVQGKSAQNSSVADYEYAIPPRNIAIKNVVLLTSRPSDLVLDRLQPKFNVAVESVYPMRGLLPLKLVQRLPELADGTQQPLGDGHFELRSRPATKSNGETSLENGKLVVAMRLRSENPPPAGVYEKGQFSFETRSADSPLRIMAEDSRNRGVDEYTFVVPYGLRMGTVGIKLSGPENRQLVVGARAATAIHPTTVELVDPTAGIAGTGQLRMEIKPDPDARIEFSPEELWIQPAGSGLVENRRRVQRIQLKKLGESLQIVFSPNLANHIDHALLYGNHPCLLTASGQGFDPVEVALTLRVDSPEVEAVVVSSATIHSCEDTTTPEVRFRARLKWLPGAELALPLKPTASIRFNDVESDGVVRASFDATLDGIRSPIELRSPTESPGGDSDWKDFSFRFAVPKNVRVGRYAGQLGFLFGGEAVTSLDLGLHINALYIEGPVIPEQKRQLFGQLVDTTARRTTEVAFPQLFDLPQTITVGLRNELNSRLDPKKLRVEITGPRQGDKSFLQNTRNPNDYVSPPKAGNVRTARDGKSLEVDFHFPSVSNAQPNVAHRIDATFSYSDESSGQDLGKANVSFYPTFVESRAIISVESVE